ncbi:MAG: VPS10 domain-containing protein [Bacteroidota bacterium]
MKRHLLLLFVCFMLSIPSLFGQKLDMEKMKGMSPRSIGPGGMSGRITAIDVVISDPSIMYAGSASGGVWKSTSGGVNWQSIFDKESVLSVGAIAIQQDNPSVIWVGTGEGNPRNSLNGGYGIYKSFDGGKNWKLMGLEKTRHIHRIIVDPKDPNTVYVAAIGSPWGEHPERGVFKTTDGGATWEKVLYVNEKTGCADLVMDPSNPNKLIASMWEHRRQPWTFKSGGPGSGIHITVDGGKTWKKLSDKDGLPEGELGRAGIAIARNKPDVIYALIESKKNALYRSTDGGLKWQSVNDKMNEIGDRPFYYCEIYVDPKNENRLYTIFSRVNVSEDGGKSFRELLPYSGVHPDHHAWWIHPHDPSFIVEGNDGGLNITHDMGKNWMFVENIPVGQFYHINVDMDHPYNVYGGLQDNGSWVGPAYVWKDDGIRNSYWQPVMFGDGFDVSPDPDDSRFGYAMSQQGFLGRYDRHTGHNKMIRPTHPDHKVKLRYNWNSAFAQDPFDRGTIYYGSQFVHKSVNRGNTWDVISPDLTTNDPEKQKQHESGGLTMDATGAENFCTILAIDPSPVEKGLIWVGTDDGNVQLTRDGGKTWTNVSPKSGVPKNGWIPQVKASKYKAGEAFVVMNNYRQFDYKPYVLRTRDFGQTWENVISPAQIGENNFALSVVQDVVEPKLIFLGTENGLWVSLDEGKNWTRWTAGFPTGVPVMDMVIHPREHDLVIGTFGRAIYVLDDVRPLREMVKEGTQVLNKTIHVFEPADAYITQTQDPAGILFAANGMFIGQNRPFGAQISYVINKPIETKKEESSEAADKKKEEQKKKDEKIAKKLSETKEVKTEEKPKTEEKKDDKKEEAKKTKYDSLTLEVFDARNMKIRTIKQKAPEDNGLNRTTWSLNEKGTRSASREKPRAGAAEPGGITVLPGTYKVRITFADQKDSAMINVRYDPRYNIPSSVIEERYKLLKVLEKLDGLALEATDRLRESKEIAEEYEKKMNSKKEEYKKALEQTKVVKDSINSLFDYILGKEDKRQGIVRRRDPTPVSYVGGARFYISSALDQVNATDQRVFKLAEDQISEVLNRVNKFYETTWPEYRAAMEKVTISPFKDYKPLERN